MFFTERQTILARDRIPIQREHLIRCDVQEPGECSDGVAAHGEPGYSIAPTILKYATSLFTTMDNFTNKKREREQSVLGGRYDPGWIH